MLDYMIYLLAFAAGSILGLLYSYKQHGEPFVAVTKLNMLALVISIIGWVLAFNGGNVILSAIGFLLGGLVMGEEYRIRQKRDCNRVDYSSNCIHIIK